MSKSLSFLKSHTGYQDRRQKWCSLMGKGHGVIIVDIQLYIYGLFGKISVSSDPTLSLHSPPMIIGRVGLLVRIADTIGEKRQEISVKIGGLGSFQSSKY